MLAQGCYAMKLTAVIGSYHKEGIIDSAVSLVTHQAEQRGINVERVYLLDKHIEYCRNCQLCVQNPEGPRGACQLQDDMEGILDQIDASDGIILASPVNFGTVTAIMKCFIERLICYGYWPWSQAAPGKRNEKMTKQALVIASCAAPAILGRYAFRSTTSVLKQGATVLGAQRVDKLFLGFSRHTPDCQLSDRHVHKTKKLADRWVSRLAAP